MIQLKWIRFSVIKEMLSNGRVQMWKKLLNRIFECKNYA